LPIAYGALKEHGQLPLSSQLGVPAAVVLSPLGITVPRVYGVSELAKGLATGTKNLTPWRRDSCAPRRPPEWDGALVPVLPLDYERQAYLLLGGKDRAELLRPFRKRK